MRTDYGCTDPHPIELTIYRSVVYPSTEFLVLAACGLALVQAHYHLACVGTHMDGTYTFMPSPQACSKYILCLNGESHIGECDNGMHFDAGRQACGEASFIDCTQCGPVGLVNLPHPDDCQRYFECRFGQRKERSCPEGHAFDRTVGACNRAENVICDGHGDDDGSPPLEPPGTPPPDGDNGDGGDGGDGGNGSLPSCRRGQVHHAHATNCNRYYLCVQGTLWEHRCPSRLHWNERAMACDLVRNARCVHGNGEGGGDDGGNDNDGSPGIRPPVDGGGADRPDVGGVPIWPSKDGRRLVRLAKDDVLF